MTFGALGDIHGDFAAVRRIMRDHPEVPFWLCVGDVADAEGRYQAFDAPLYWIKGNNENFDAIDAGELPAGLHYIRNGTCVDIDLDRTGSTIPASLTADSAGGPQSARVRVAGLGGTFAPTMYDTPAAQLPHPKKGSAKATELADRRRHFVREEVDACGRMERVDVLLTHEAPRPFRVNGRIDAGKTPINEVLAAMQPRLHLFGHHHRFVEGEAQGVRSVCLDLVGRSYLLIRVPALKYDVIS